MNWKRRRYNYSFFGFNSSLFNHNLWLLLSFIIFPNSNHNHNGKSKQNKADCLPYTGKESMARFLQNIFKIFSCPWLPSASSADPLLLIPILLAHGFISCQSSSSSSLSPVINIVFPKSCILRIYFIFCTFSFPWSHLLHNFSNSKPSWAQCYHVLQIAHF